MRDTDSLARDVLGAINTSFANVSDSELGKMPIGQSVMQSIVSSMQNIDSSVMGTLNIGQGIMDTINASLSNIDASAMGTLPIGQTVMNAIGNSITNISPDLSADLNIGESLMASVNSSLASVDFSSLDFNIGASLMSKLNESLSPENIGGAIDGSAIGASVMSSINAGLSSAELTVTPTVKVVPNYVMENGGAGLLEQLSQMSLSMQATTSATVKYGLDASAIDGYTPSDKTGVVKYSVDSSAVDGYSPPNKSATVTYYITTVGTIPDPGSIHHAMGTPFAMDEFATINDQITANPTEMVVHNNRGYLFAGRNVQIPLSTGDRVFTASQTQRMLSGNFDEGYNNQIVPGRYDDSIFGEDNSGNTVASGSIMVNLGGIAFHIDASGANGDVLTAIEENYETIAREVTNIIKQNLEDNFRNTPKRITM